MKIKPDLKDWQVAREVFGKNTKTECNLIKSLRKQEIYNEFYKLMEKHGIWQWHKSEIGHTGSSPEYVMCHTVFKQHLEMQLTWFGLGITDCDFEVPDYMWEGGER